jgi:class 3 adenylate cyclase
VLEGGQESCALPDDPLLAEAASALNEGRAWALVLDAEWRWVYMSDDARLSSGSQLGMVPVPLGAHFFSAAAIESGVLGQTFGLDSMSDHLMGLGSWMLADAGGERDALREVVHEGLRDVVDAIDPSARSLVRTYPVRGWYTAGSPTRLLVTAWRISDANGRIVGTAAEMRPDVGMSVIGTLASSGEHGHFARMQSVAKAARRPAAILFADLEGSSPLARRLPTASYFALGRRLVRAADRCVVEAGGLVGRHVGDGTVAFFLADNLGSESAAAHACISAARALREAAHDVAARSDLGPEDVSLRFGLHWGSTLFVGQIATSARFEVTALGDEVNQTARIEACATGARALASRDLIERLDPLAAASLDLEPDRITYTALGDLGTATDKARRDAPAIAVCEI